MEVVQLTDFQCPFFLISMWPHLTTLIMDGGNTSIHHASMKNKWWWVWAEKWVVRERIGKFEFKEETDTRHDVHYVPNMLVVLYFGQFPRLAKLKEQGRSVFVVKATHFP